jgi:N-acetylmuramoyl-L-alanine amidase
MVFQPTTQVVNGAAPATSPTSAPNAEALRGRIVVIDPGHDGGNASHPAEVSRLVPDGNGVKACDTSGAETDAGYPEHAFAFDVASRLANLLRAAGASVVLTRVADDGVGPCVNDRAAIGNRAHADVAISIHADGGPPWGRGFEMIYPGKVADLPDSVRMASFAFAQDLRAHFEAESGEPRANYVGVDGLDERVDLAGLNLTTVPKVFVECANMRNSLDALLVSDSGWRQRAAVALADGIGHYLAPTQWR